MMAIVTYYYWCSFSSPAERNAAGTCYIIFGKEDNSDDKNLSNLSSSKGLKFLA